MTDPDAVAAAVVEAIEAARVAGGSEGECEALPRADDASRTTEAIAAAHADLYREVLGW